MGTTASKKHLLVGGLFAFTLLISSFVPSHALAATRQIDVDGFSAADCTAAGGTIRGTQAGRFCDIPDAPTGDPAAAGDTTDGSAADNDSSNWWDFLKNGTIAAVLAPIAVLAWLFFKIASLILGLAGIVFNWTVAVVVFQFSTYLGNSPGMLMAWSILRDFGNIALIFGFVYMGIRTILDIGHFNTGKTLASLVVFAVLLNFSLFAAEAVVDTSNVLAASLYEQAQTEEACNNASWLDCVISTGLAGQVLTKINITSAYGDGDGNVISGTVAYFQNPLPHILKYIGLSLLVTTAAMVFIAGAIMLISRGVILAFLMVTSPIGFAGMAIPPLQKLAKDWWKKLLNQAFFAPAFVLLLLVSLKMTDGLNQLARADGGLASAISSPHVADTGSLIIFALIIGFMWGSLMLANKFGIYFSDLATSTAGRLTYGAMGMIGRRTIGRQAFRMKANLANTNFARTGLGRLTVGGLDWAAKGNYNALSTKPAKDIAGLTKVNLGSQQHGGFDHIVHEGTKKQKEYATNYLKKTPEEEQAIKDAEQRTKDVKQGGEDARARKAKFEKDMQESQAVIDENQKTLDALQTDEKKKERQQREEEIVAKGILMNSLPAGPERQAAEEALNELTEARNEVASKEKEVAESAQREIDARQKVVEGLQKNIERENVTLSDLDDSTRLAAAEEKQAKHDNDPKHKYAEHLIAEVDADTLMGALLRRTAAGNHPAEVYKHAAHELEEESTKTELQKMTDKITGALKENRQVAHSDAKKVAHTMADAHAETAHGDHQDDHPH